MGAEDDFGKGRDYIKEGLRRAGVGPTDSGGERYVGIDRSTSTAMIRQGLAEAGGRSPDRGLASSDDIGRELMRRSEERLAAERGHGDDGKPRGQLSGLDMIKQGLAKANGTFTPTSNKMSDPPRTTPR
jgi:hypothetical protein